MTSDAQQLPNRSLLKLMAAAVPVVLVLILAPSFVDTYRLQLLIYGLIAAIAALGFNLLLGYTGLLSFGHSAYFGVGAYSVAFVVEHLGPHSMEFYLLVGIPIVAITSAMFGYICVRHTRIFFGILTLAISQGGLQLGAEALLGDRRQRRVAGPPASVIAGIAQLLGAPGVPALCEVILLLRAGDFRCLRHPDVGDRPFAVRQGATRHSR
jgi:ABC-type branched-subunit amino acid transport system permease subunit